MRSSTGANSAFLLRGTLALQARGCQSAPSVRPSQSLTNRSRGSGVRRHSWSRKPGPGGLVQLRRALGYPAAGERTSGGQSGGECQLAACAPGPGRAEPLPPERTIAWLLPGASRLLSPFLRALALELPARCRGAAAPGSWLGHLNLEREAPAQGGAELKPPAAAALVRSSPSCSRSLGGAGREHLHPQLSRLAATPAGAAAARRSPDFRAAKDPFP